MRHPRAAANPPPPAPPAPPTARQPRRGLRNHPLRPRCSTPPALTGRMHARACPAIARIAAAAARAASYFDPGLPGMAIAAGATAAAPGGILSMLAGHRPVR